MPHANLIGQVYRCPVCGAEVSVIAAGNGWLAPLCCNRVMALQPVSHDSYYCPVCGAEVMVLKSGGGNLVPKCCNQEMDLRAAG
jgi:desulfoferrodoxin-like iron-binding protein